MPISSRLLALVLFTLLVPFPVQAGDLFQAIDNSDVAEVRRLLRDEPRLVHKADAYGNYPLHRALRGRQLDMVRALIDARADIRALDRNAGTTPLHVAAANNFREAAELLIARGADVNAASRNDALTPLHGAAQGGGLEVARLLLAKGADVEGGFGGKSKQSSGSPLSWAVRERHTRVARFLLAKGANPNLRSGFVSDAPLRIAAEAGDPDLVKLLLAKGARIDSPTTLVTALTSPAPRKREVVDLLLSQRMDVSSPEYLVAACSSGDRELVELLLKRGADVNAAALLAGGTPLRAAVQSGAVDVVALLLKKGADAKAADPARNTALHFAAQWMTTPFGARVAVKSGRAIAKLLLARGAGLNDTNKQEQTPAFLAAQRGDRQLLEYLAERGAKLDCYSLAALGRVEALRKRLQSEKLPGSPGEYLYPPLHLAALYGQTETVALLLERGADVNQAGPYGTTPLHVAAFAGHAKVAELLLKRGAKLNAPLSESLYVNRSATPLELAFQRGQVDMVRLLASKNASPKLDKAARERWMHNAVQNKHLRLVLWLQEQGMSMDPQVFRQTPLHLAAEVGDLATLKVLLADGADLKAASAVNYHTPLHLAIRGQNRDMIEVLLARGADANLNSPLTTAVQTGNIQLAELLIRKGAKVKAMQDPWSPLPAACQMGNVEMVELLLDHGADLKQANGDFLHLAALYGRIDVVKLLLKRGADINVNLRQGHMLYTGLLQERPEVLALLRDKDKKPQPIPGGGLVLVPSASSEGFLVGGTPLHAAVVGKQTAIVELLLAQGAKVPPTLPSGATLLHLAAAQGDISTLKLLLTKGLDMQVKDARGATPLRMALQADEEEAVAFLREKGAKP